MEQAAGDRAAPELAVALRALERPHLHDVPRDRRVAHRVDIDDVLGLRWVGRDGSLLPGGTAVARALHLDAEVAHVLRGVQRAVALREHHRDRVAKQLGTLDAPIAATAPDDEYPFLGADEQLVSHGLASRKRLKNIDFTVVVNAIRQLPAVLDVVAVDEDFDVMPNLALVVEDVAAHTGPGYEVAFEKLGDRVGGERGRGAFGVPRQVLGEMQVRHGAAPHAAERASTWYGVSSGIRQFASGIRIVVTRACCPVSTE